MTVKYFLQGKKDLVPIYVRLREGISIDAKAKTNFFISPKDWSTAKGLPKQNDAKLKKLKADLESLTSTLLTAFNNANVDEVINSNWLKAIINPTKDEAAIPSHLTKYIDYYIQCKQHEVGEASIKKFRAIQNKMQLMETERGSPIMIKDINEAFKQEFVQWYQDRNYATNTIYKEMKFIKTFCKHARHNGIETSYQLDGLKTTKEPVEKVFLSFDELNQIQATKLDRQALDNARDWLIVSCYTGQRISDFLDFTNDMIRVEQGVQLLEFTQKKTGKRMSLAVHPKIIEVMDKNSGNFPRKISAPKYNLYIKEVCKLAGITEMTKGSRVNPDTNRKESGTYPKYELVTSHIGRRSFCTNHFNIVPTSLLISASGHSTEAMFLEYIGKTQTQQAKDLAKYFS